MIRGEIGWIKFKLTLYARKPSFWVWEFIWLTTLCCIWKYVVMLVLLLYCYTFLFYVLDKLVIRIDNKYKYTIAIGLMQINFLNLMQESKLDKNAIKSLFFFQIFRMVFGVTYKSLKVGFSFYDCVIGEYEYSNMASKKLIWKIWKKFICRSLEKFIFIEFVKKAPIAEKTMTFEIKKIKREVKVIIVNEDC